MPNQIIEDLFDLLRLRVKPLAHYAYPNWQLAILIVLSGVAGAAVDKQYIPILALHIISAVISYAVYLWVQSYFFQWWLRRGGRWNGTDSLFPIMVLTGSVLFFFPLLLLFPDDLAGILLLPFLVIKSIVRIVAISRATGVAIGYVIGGALLIYIVSVLMALPFAFK